MATLDHRNVYINSQTFCQLIEIGSFSGVAHKLNVSQPTVSRRVAALEEELGIQLIQRNTRSFKINEPGQRYYDFFTMQDHDFKRGIQKFQNQTRDDRMTVRLVMPMGICNSVISPHIPEFLQKHPQLTLQILYQNREVDLIRENYDIVIIRHVPKHQTLKIKKLYQSRLNLYCSPEYIERYGLLNNIEDINEHLVIGGIHDDNTINFNTEVLDNEDRLSTFETKLRCIINNLEPALKMALSGHAIIGGLDFLYQNEIDSGKLVKLLPDFQFSLFTFYMVKINALQHPVIEELSLFIQKCFQNVEALPSKRSFDPLHDYDI